MYTVLLLLICLWFIRIGDIYFALASSEIRINDNITKEAYSNGIILKCSFTIEEGEEFAAMTLAIENSTSGIMQALAGFSSKASPKLTSFGMYLFGNETTLISFKEPQYTFFLTFNNLTCRHEHRYKCILTVLVPTDGYKAIEIESDIMSIAVTVPPSKPEMTTMENDIPSSKRIKRSANLTSTNDTHTIELIEGDNITFMCKGDVGRPKGRFVWQKIHSSNSNSYYSNISTETIPVSCSYEGNSTLTIQVTDDDNQAIIRCIVKSELPNGTSHVDSEPLLIHFKVRRPFIELLPNKTVFQEGDSVQLNCKAHGNPNPSYSWTKDNKSEEIIVDHDILVINKANISDTGLYTCDTRNSIDGTVYSESMSTYIKIENISTTPSTATINPSGTDNTQDEFIRYISGSVAGFLILLIFIGICVYKNRKLLEVNTKPTSESFSENSATDNPGYTSVSETNIDRNIKDCGNAMDARKYTLENEEKLLRQENKEIEFGNPTNQTNNEVASYAYVTVSSDYHAGKETNIDSQEMLKPSTIDEKNTPSTTVLSEYAKENMDEMLKYRNENTCDNLPDHYASSLSEIYDALHNKRHETDNGEKFDKMFELKSLPENMNQSIERNESFEPQDSTMLNCHAPPLEKSKPGGYESVVIEDGVPVLSSEGNGSVHGDIEIVSNNKEYLQHQKEEEETLNKSPISTQPVEYAQVNETTKLKNRKKQNNTDQELVDTNAEIHEGIQVESEERHAKTDENDDHLDKTKIISKENSDEETESLFKASHSICNINPTFENDGVSGKNEQIKVAMVFPTIRLAGSSDEHKQKETTNAETNDRVNLSQKVDDDDDEYSNTTRNVKSLPSSEDNTQTENKNAEIEQGINDRSTRTVDNLGYFDTTTYLRKQQTNGNPESSIKNDQTGSYIERDENQKVDAVSPFRSTDGLQDDGERNQDSDKHSKNGYENVGSIDQTEL